MVTVLLEKEKSLSAVAVLVGFGSTRSLARFIHHNFGMSPSELQGKLREEVAKKKR